MTQPAPVANERPAVYIGRNMLTINQSTMNCIVEYWINATHSGGPYKVISVEQDETPPVGFAVMFESVERTKENP